MECVILWRNTQNGAVGFISNEEGDLEVFANRDDAGSFALNSGLLQAFPYQIVELEEL